MLRVYAKFKNQVYFFVNIYSSCFVDKKRLLWNDAIKLKMNFGEGYWYLGGDFKFISDKKEMIGRSF